MESLWKKIDDYADRLGMIEHGDTILAAVSGGADSMCMLHYLIERKEMCGFDLAVFHFNHHLREEAGNDAEFVRDFCAEHGISVYVSEGDVQREAEEGKLTIEEAARKLRYNAMFEVAESLRRTKVVKHKEAHNNKKRVVLAFAHNAGDRAETVLFRLFRGTGLKGLRGIEAVSQRNGFKIIRPLLSCSRPEIEAYMISSGGNWVEDKTNAEDEYSRNKIRHHILGFATDNINKKSVENICRAAEDATDAYDYISRQAQKAYESIVELREAHKTINISKFKQLDPFLQKQVLLLFFEEHTQARKDLTKDHFEVVLGLLWTSGNKKYNLPYGLTAVKEYDSFYLDTKRDSKELSDSNYHTGKLDYTIQQIVLDYTKDMEIPISTYTKWLDYDKIHSRVEIRNRRAGDYICINDAGNRMSLKKYFINEKIPASMRPRIVVVADGSHVLWVVGYRISADVKISGDTKRVLALSAIQNQN